MTSGSWHGRIASSHEGSPELEALLEYLRVRRGFDFTGYKRASLTRRITKRMQAAHLDSFAAYRDYLEANAGEFELLFDTILINVTGFFRDAETWDFLRGEVVPTIIAQKEPHEAIRVWSAGCATGEEAYTLAIVLAEALGPQEFRDRVKIYATDVDKDALIAARSGRFSTTAVEQLSPELVERYFDRADTHVAFRKDLRRSVVFGRNDLIQDAPISRIDLLTCRNALMYFDTPTQRRIVARFFFALNERGYLVLGKAETLIAHMTMFNAVDLKRRVFQKVGGGRGSARLLQPARPESPRPISEASGANLRDAALRAGPVAQIVIDEHGLLMFANERASSLFRLGMADVGRPFADLEVSYKPIDVRPLIDEARAQGQVVDRTGVEWRAHGSTDVRWFDVQVVPLQSEEGTFLGTSVMLADVAAQRQLQIDLQASENELQAAYEELHSTNEELATTNEELHSTVEELETTNEELHSTNEELETMNEELQSTNEELQTMNDELRVSGDELNQANHFLEQILTSLRYGVAVVDANFRVLVWNRKAEDLWGLRADEVEGGHLLDLDIGLPVEQLRQPIAAAMAGVDASLQEIVLLATNRRGRRIQCRVTCDPLVGRGGGAPDGVIVTMEELLTVTGGVGRGE